MQQRQQYDVLTQRKAELRAAITVRNTLLHSLITRLRRLVDSFAMWAAHEQQLVQGAVPHAAAAASAGGGP